MSLFAAPVGAVALSAATIFAIKGRVKLHEACLSASALLMLLTIGVSAASTKRGYAAGSYGWEFRSSR